MNNGKKYKYSVRLNPDLHSIYSIHRLQTIYCQSIEIGKKAKSKASPMLWYVLFVPWQRD